MNGAFMIRAPQGFELIVLAALGIFIVVGAVVGIWMIRVLRRREDG
jgi:hypothetical protein